MSSPSEIDDFLRGGQTENQYSQCLMDSDGLVGYAPDSGYPHSTTLHVFIPYLSLSVAAAVVWTLCYRRRC